MRITLRASLLSTILLLTSCNPGDPVVIPKVEDIEEMEVKMYGLNRVVTGRETEGLEDLKFSVPKEHWEPILDSFRPYERGTTWTNGFVGGDITLKLNDGTSFNIRVLVFGSRNDEIHPWLGPECITHVGGSARELNEALLAAFQASQENDQTPDLIRE